MAARRIAQLVGDFLRFLRRVDMRDDDAQRAANQRQVGHYLVQQRLAALLGGRCRLRRRRRLQRIEAFFQFGDFLLRLLQLQRLFGNHGGSVNRWRRGGSGNRLQLHQLFRSGGRFGGRGPGLT